MPEWTSAIARLQGERCRFIWPSSTIQYRDRHYGRRDGGYRRNFGRNAGIGIGAGIIGGIDIVSAFQDAGAFVSVATTLADATHLVEQDGLSAAVLDFGHDANELCARLRARGIPFVLHSGFGIMGDACVGGVVIPKPAATSDLIEAISSLLPRSN